MDIIFLVLPASKVEIIGHYKLKASIVVQSSDYNKANPAKSTEKASNFRQKVQRAINRTEVEMLVQGNFESNSGPKPISVRHRASRHLTYEKTRFVIVVKAPVVVLQIEFGSSDELYSVSTQIGIDRLPVYISILVYARFTKFMLNKALFVCYSNYVFEYQPFVDLFFFKAIETLGRVGRITFFKNNQK